MDCFFGIFSDDSVLCEQLRNREFALGFPRHDWRRTIAAVPEKTAVFTRNARRAVKSASVYPRTFRPCAGPKEVGHTELLRNHVPSPRTLCNREQFPWGSAVIVGLGLSANALAVSRHRADQGRFRYSKKARQNAASHFGGENLCLRTISATRMNLARIRPGSLAILSKYRMYLLPILRACRNC